MKDNIPTVLSDALFLLDLSSIHLSHKMIMQAFLRKTSMSYNLQHNILFTQPSFDQMTAYISAKKLLLSYLKTGTFRFHCANCCYNTTWDISLYVEIDNILLCHTCQKGLLKILNENPTFKTTAQLDREAKARQKEEELQAAWRQRMKERGIPV